jgi:hypothetical protein
MLKRKYLSLQRDFIRYVFRFLIFITAVVRENIGSFFRKFVKTT